MVLILTEDYSFRPLTGIMVLIKYTKKLKHKKARQFPSPYGDYGSYLTLFTTTVVTLRGSSFRPLTGIMVLIGD